MSNQHHQTYQVQPQLLRETPQLKHPTKTARLAPSPGTELITFDLKDLEDTHLIESDHDKQDPLSEHGDEDIELDNPTHSMLQWHYRLGHAPFSKVQQMAKEGKLP